MEKYRLKTNFIQVWQPKVKMGKPTRVGEKAKTRTFSIGEIVEGEVIEITPKAPAGQKATQAVEKYVRVEEGGGYYDIPINALEQYKEKNMAQTVIGVGLGIIAIYLILQVAKAK